MALNGLVCADVPLRNYSLTHLLNEGHSINSRTVFLSKHTMTVENQNYYEVLHPLLYIT